MKNVVLILAFVWILGGVFFYRFLYCTKSRTKYGRMIITRSSELKLSHSVIIVAINYLCLFKTMFAFY